MIPGYEDLLEKEKSESKKKKKKKKKHYEADDFLTKEDREYGIQLADSIEAYLDNFDRYCICDGMDEKEYEKSYKTIKKMCQMLRDGAFSKCMDMDRYYAMLDGEYKDIYNEEDGEY